MPPSDLFPLADEIDEDPRWPLRVYFCRSCALVQLGPEAPAEPEVPLAVESQTAKDHGKRSVQHIIRQEGLSPGATVIEVDSPHGGTWLEEFQRHGLLRQGPEGKADLVVDVQGLVHEQRLAAPLAAHAKRLNPGGKLVIEFHHLLSLVEQSQIDLIRHGHWVYLSVTCLQRLAAPLHLTISRVVEAPIYGGSVQVTLGRTGDRPVVDRSVGDVLYREEEAGLSAPDRLRAFGSEAASATGALRDHLVDCRRSGRSVAGYGAPSKAPVLVGLAGLDHHLLPFTVDLSPAKHGRRLPGSRIPILSPDELLVRRPDEVIVFTWDIADEIARQLSRAARGTNWIPRLYVPLPQPHYVDVGDR